MRRTRGISLDEQNDAKYEVTIVITDGSHSTMV